MKKLKSVAVMLVMLMFVGIFAGCEKSEDKETKSDAKASKETVSEKINDEKTTGNSKLSKETVFEMYNKVQMDQTKEQVDKELGVTGKESSQLKNLFNYVNPDTSYGVSVLFNDKNQVTSKTLTYPARERLAALCGKKYTEAQSDKIVKGTSWEDVVKILGNDGIEVSQTQIPFADNKISSIHIWVNKDGSMAQVVMGTDGKSNDSIFFD